MPITDYERFFVQIHGPPSTVADAVEGVQDLEKLDLKSCPHCGGAATVKDGGKIIFCSKLRCREVMGDNAKDPVELWNAP